MFRKIALAGLAAFAIAAAPIAASQAQAKNNLERLLIGVTALAIIGSIANSSSKQSHRRNNGHYQNNDHYQAPRQQNHATQYNTHQRQHVRPHKQHKQRHHTNRYNQHKQHQYVKPHHHKRAGRMGSITEYGRPKNCQRKYWERGGWVKYYDNKCLTRHTAKHRRHAHWAHR